MTNSTTTPKPVIYPRPLNQARTHGDIAIAAVGYQPYKNNWIDHHFQMHAVGLVVSGQGTYRMTPAPLPTPPASLPTPPSDLPSPAEATPEPPTASRASPATNRSHPGAAGRPFFGAAASGVAAEATVQPGSMFTVFPGPLFTYGPTPVPAWEEYYFCALGPGVQRWIDFGWFPVDGQVYRLADAALAVAIEAYRELMRVQHRAEPGDADRAVTLAERLLIEMVHGRAAVAHARQPGHSIAAVLAFCQENFARPIDFPALASDHAMSYSSLRQRLKQVTGAPPAQYQIQLRCQKAQALLSDTDLSIKAIGAAVGIADPYAFSRTFKKCVGLAPDLYRRQTAPWAAARRRTRASAPTPSAKEIPPDPRA